jgi:hypothetical protein
MDRITNSKDLSNHAKELMLKKLKGNQANFTHLKPSLDEHKAIIE